MGYYTVNFDDKTENDDLLEEYLLHKQSMKMNQSFENNNENALEQTWVKNKECKCKEEKEEIINLHCGELTNKFVNIIKVILKEYTDLQTDEVSIGKLEKEIITEIVDKVIERARHEMNELEDIIFEKSHYPFGRYYLLRQMIEILLFSGLF